MTRHLMDLAKGKGRAAKQVADRLREAGHTAYFAGGCVRDMLMSKTPQDFDIATTAIPEQVEGLFTKTVAVGKQFGVILVVKSEKQIVEVATFRREGGYQDGRHPGHVDFTGPEEDARRRDFTVNGLFYDPFDQKVLDYIGGVEDIQRRVIRAIGDPFERFEEDKLRLLRAVRFASSLDFEIEATTWKALCQKAHDINQVSPERIREELIKMMTRPGAARGFELLSQCGLMKEILPEIDMMKGVEQPAEYHPEGDVFTHTKLLLEHLNRPTATLAMSALLHDIAKPKTVQTREGRILFYEHAPLGARMARDILRRLRFSNQEIQTVVEAVENHMKFGDVQRMREGKLKTFIARPNFREELELHRIDCLASHGMLDNYQFLQAKLKEYEREQLKPKPFLNGHDLLAAGMNPGPEMKPVLEEAYTLQLEGRFRDRKEALKWLRSELQAVVRASKTGRKTLSRRKPADTVRPGKGGPRASLQGKSKKGREG